MKRNANVSNGITFATVRYRLFSFLCRSVDRMSFHCSHWHFFSSSFPSPYISMSITRKSVTISFPKYLNNFLFCFVFFLFFFVFFRFFFVFFCFFYCLYFLSQLCLLLRTFENK